MFKFYLYLKDHLLQIGLLPEEKKFASGKFELSSTKLAKITQCHNAYQQLLKNAFTQQQEKATVSKPSFFQNLSFYHRNSGALEPRNI